MFVMLSVYSTSVCERHAKSTAKKTLTNLDNLLQNKNSIEKLFTKSASFDKNINQTNLILTQPNNLKQPPVQQVIHVEIISSYFSVSFYFSRFSFLHRIQ